MNEKRVHGMLGFAMRAGKLVIGTELVCRAMQKRSKDKVNLVVVCEGISEATKRKILKKSEFYGIKTVQIPTQTEALGALLGKLFAPACVAVTDEAFAQQIINASSDQH